MIYPLNIFTLDPTSKSIRPFIIFIAQKIEVNIMKAKSWAHAFNIKSPQGGFILPLPNTGLIDSSSNQYDGNASELIAGLFNEKVFPNALKKPLQHAGVIPDPRLTSLYQGSAPRQFSATWEIIPQSLAESASVALILMNLKKWCAPERKSDPLNKIGVLKQPYSFKLIFSNPLLDRALDYKDMVVTSYSINYASQGYFTSYWDGTPKAISLTINFAENGIKTKIDWDI